MTAPTDAPTYPVAYASAKAMAEAMVGKGGTPRTVAASAYLAVAAELMLSREPPIAERSRRPVAELAYKVADVIAAPGDNAGIKAL